MGTMHAFYAFNPLKAVIATVNVHLIFAHLFVTIFLSSYI